MVTPTPPDGPFYVLSLDGGGSKGVYSLGVLREIEILVGKPLARHFHLVYGTSTGAIIASLLALGETVDAVSDCYFTLIPDVMRRRTRRGRSRALLRHASEVFGTRGFADFQTNVGIVATHYDYKRPMIFKSSPSQAHGRQGSFVPGFGCTIAEAVVASCAAFPFFGRATVRTTNQGAPELLDGGFVANNPALFAIADATLAMGIERPKVRLLSIGVGDYPQAPTSFLVRTLRKLWPFQMLDFTFGANTNTVDLIRRLLFPDIATVRVHDSFVDGKYSTSLLESDLVKLGKLKDLGRESFGTREAALRKLLL
jgi:predicted acylesterase/phospholipase RssA